MPKIILATTSPYRIEAFEFLGIDFQAEGSKVDESQADRKDPEKLVETLSRMKAEAVAKNHKGPLVIGMDSVAFFEGKILEKPRSREEDFERLKALSGKHHQFFTGIFMVNTATGQKNTAVVKTEIFFREISEEEINQYLDSDPYFNTYALGYDPLRHISSSFISKIEGSYNNIIRGIPLEVVVGMLHNMGIKSGT